GIAARHADNPQSLQPMASRLRSRPRQPIGPADWAIGRSVHRTDQGFFADGARRIFARTSGLLLTIDLVQIRTARLALRTSYIVARGSRTPRRLGGPQPLPLRIPANIDSTPKRKTVLLSQQLHS